MGKESNNTIVGIREAEHKRQDSRVIIDDPNYSDEVWEFQKDWITEQEYNE